jgi:hypothetical protein
LNVALEGGCGDEVEIGFAGQQASQAPDGVFDAALLPGAVGIAEESLYAEGFVEPVMLGEFVSVIEADGFAYVLWKLAELTRDGVGGENSFSIEGALNDTEAGFSFVENQQSLARLGEQHEVGFPMSGRPATFDLGGAFGDRAPLFDEAGGATSAAPSYFFVARQQAIPAIFLGRTMIDETID